MRTIALVNEMVASGVVRPGLKPIYMHRIDGGKALATMPAASKLAPKPETLEQLFALGQDSATRWLRKHFDTVGTRGTIDLHRDYGDPLKLDFELPHDEPAAASAVAAPPAIEPAPDLARFRWSPEAQSDAARHADTAAKAAASAHDGQQLNGAEPPVSRTEDHAAYRRAQPVAAGRANPARRGARWAARTACASCLELAPRGRLLKQ